MSDEIPQSDTPESPKTLDSETVLTDEVEMEEEKPESEEERSNKALDVEMEDGYPSTPPLSLGGADGQLYVSEEVQDSETDDEEEERKDRRKTSRSRSEPRKRGWVDYYPSQSRFDPWGYSGWQEEKSPPPDVGAGLKNLGNSCFLNAVLQCLMHTVPLLDGMVLDKDSWICDCETGKFCLLCSLRELVDLSFNSTDRYVEPYKLVNNLNYFSSSFERYQQEDAHEFLQSFLDRLENCFGIKRNSNVSAQCNNVVKRVFGGRLVSKLKCCSCGHCSNSYEACVDYSLEVEDSDDLLTALQSFTKVEKLEDPETKFSCEGCKEKVSIDKQYAFDQAPSVAAFHLKRFQNEGSFVRKIDKHVSFPKELDLRPFIGSDNMTDEHLIYNLFAIVVHSGFTSTSGHYYCYIRLSSDMWCKFNDHMVYEVHENVVLKEEAYILFYAKEGTPWFSNFIESHKSCFTSKASSTSPKSVLDNVDSPAVLEKNSCDPSEASAASIYWRFEVIDIQDTKPKPDDVEGDKIKDVEHASSSPKFSTDGSSDIPVQNVKEEASPSLPKKVKSSNADTSAVGKKLSLDPDMFLRSPSPEIYREDKPDTGYSIPRQHLKLINRSNCKRRLERDMDDMESRQACSYMKKNMQGSRAKQFMDAMRGSKSEGPKKSRRFTGFDSVDNKNSTPNIRHMVR